LKKRIRPTNAANRKPGKEKTCPITPSVRHAE
jgi:hypothetical protein